MTTSSASDPERFRSGESASQRLFLIGPMAAGKSAVGRRLAARLDAPFVDTDAEIERRTGVDIDYIFEREGEAGFRRRESAVISELTARQPIVISTGGGAILAPANREVLHERGLVIYLSTSVATQLARTRHSHHRPLLKTGDREATLNALAAQRNPLYESIADITLSTNGRGVEPVVNELLRLLRVRGNDLGGGGGTVSAHDGGPPERASTAPAPASSSNHNNHHDS